MFVVLFSLLVFFLLYLLLLISLSSIIFQRSKIFRIIFAKLQRIIFETPYNKKKVSIFWLFHHISDHLKMMFYLNYRSFTRIARTFLPLYTVDWFEEICRQNRITLMAVLEWLFERVQCHFLSLSKTLTGSFHSRSTFFFC